MAAGRSRALNDDVDELITEQQAYYRARADEYDDWWERRGDFDDGPEFTSAWRRDIDELRAWLTSAAPLGDVLELAAGTGNWTRELVRHASTVTALDSSDETLAVNRTKLGDARVDHVVADVFRWEPPRVYDTVFCGFWISHVPTARWTGFWALVDRALAPEGRILFCDNAHPRHAGENGPSRKPRRAAHRGEDRRAGTDRVVRTLTDGSRYEIVKRYWTPDELRHDLATLGWEADVTETSFAFLRGEAWRRRASP